MSEYRDVLERSRQQFRPDPAAFERLRRRRDRKVRNKRVAAAALALILAAAAIGGAIHIFRSAGKTTPAEPTITSSAITDAKGDAGVPTSLAREYLDIVSAVVSKEGESFTFAFTLTAPIPPTFDVPKPYNALGWEFCIDTDLSNTYIPGYPFGPTTTASCEFIVDEVSRGGDVVGTLIDRRPLLDGKDATSRPIPVTISGTEVLTSVPASSIGEPGAFTWILFTTDKTLPQGTDRFVNMDEAPDGSFSNPARWPSG